MKRFAFGVFALRRDWKRVLLVPSTITLLASLLISCFENPLSPVAPTWDVTLNVPLLNRSYNVSHLIEKDSALFRNDPSGLLVFSKSQEFSGVSVAGNLRIDPVTENFLVPIGTFSIKVPSTPTGQVSVGEMNPSLGSQQGNSVLVPPFSFSLVRKSLPPIPDFDYVTLFRGETVITLINTSGIPLDNLSLTVYDENEVVALLTHHSSLLPGDSVKQPFPLVSRTVGNSFWFDFSGRSAGTDRPVYVDTSSAVLVRLDFSSDIEAVKAVAKLPASSFSTAGTIVIDDSTRIESGVIKSGNVTLSLSNRIGVSGQVSVIIPNLQQPNGLALSYSVPFGALHQNLRFVTSLAGYSIQSTDGRVNYTVTIRTNDSGNEMVTIDSSMGFSCSLVTSEISFQSIRGRIKPRNVDINMTRSFDLSEVNRIFSGTARFSQARMVVTLKTPAQYPVDLMAILTGKNHLTGQSANLSLPAIQRRISYPQTAITLTESNSDLISFLNSFSNQLPDQFSLVGSAVINPTYSSGSISSTDTLGAELALDLPLRVGIVNGTARDTLNLAISSDTRKEIQKANYGKVSFEIENGLPAGVEVSVEFLDAQHHRLLVLPQPQQPALSIKGAQVDANGRAILPATSSSYIELVNTDVRKFQEAQYIAFFMTIRTSGTGGSPVEFRTSDTVRVRAYSTLSYRVNGK